MLEHSFPRIRMRRLRSREGIRDLASETLIRQDKLIQPIFISMKKHATNRELEDMVTLTPEEVTGYIHRLMDLGVKSFLLFGVPNTKTNNASNAYDPRGPVQQAIRTIRREIGWDPVIATDICVCSYTEHGHCGIVRETAKGKVIDNDATIGVLGKIAVSHAEAGADIVAPSAMMDGQVKAIRESLDDAGFTDVAIMSYSAKYASSLYSPFRDVADSTPLFGDRRSYQMDPRNLHEALREIELDIREGADIVMVKPALWYLDVIYLAKRTFPTHPLAAYNVSGEYAMLKAAAKLGYIDERSAMMEMITSIMRAGADIVITYLAEKIAMILKGYP